MAITPDTKDWTWVLDARCAECGFDPATVSRASLSARLRMAATTVQRALADPDVHQRPQASTWSKLEYGCHVRDVSTIMLRRLRMILDDDEPTFANWDQDATAAAERYDEQHARKVAAELELDAAALADAYYSMPEDAWDRVGHRSNGSAFTAYTLGVYALHDFEHHAWDVTKHR